ncbi:hypothetical protein DITRI_Ditri02bG0059300 [Diplodiscus trichospermus]
MEKRNPLQNGNIVVDKLLAVDDGDRDGYGSTLIFLGTGSSGAVPNAMCLILYLIILTHEHADAVLGLDDIRVVQPHSPTNDIDPPPFT